MAYIESQTAAAAAAMGSPVPSKNVAADGSCDDATALAIMIADMQADESYISEKMWALRWREIDTLYQSPRPISMWEGSSVQEANVQSFMVAKHTNTIVPAVMNGIFFQAPFFLLKSTPGMTEELIRQKTTLFSVLFREMEFEEACWDGWFYTVLFGTAIYKWGTKTYPKDRPVYKRRGKKKTLTGKFLNERVATDESQTIDVEDRASDFWTPYLEHIPNEEVLVDSTLTKPDIRKAKHVTHIRYMTGYQLIDMCREHEGEEGWNIPSEETIREWFAPPKEMPQAPDTPLAVMGAVSVVVHAKEEQVASHGDPLEQVMKVAERVSNKRITLAVQDKYVLRNGRNPWGRINYLSSHWWRIPRSFWSLGIGHLAGQEQRVDQGTRNAALNLLSMAVNPPMLRLQTDNQPGQNIRLRRGAIIAVEGTDDVRKGFSVMEMPRIPSELWPVLANNSQTAEESTGADQRLAQGNTGGSGTSMGRTASGAVQLASAQSNRLQGPITRFVKTVLEPFVYIVDELVNEEMPEKQIVEILGDEMGDEYAQSFDLEKYLNGRTKFEILAAQHIAAKKGMAQMLPLLSQIFENQQLLKQLNDTGWTIDVRELVSMFMEISEWTNRKDLIRRMTPEEKQHMVQMQQVAPMAAVKGKMALNEQKGQQQSQNNAQKNDGRAMDIVLRKGMESALEPEVLTGESGGPYGGEEATGT